MSTGNRNNPKSFYNNLPLHIAAHCYDHYTLKNLLKQGLDPNARDRLLQTPLHVLLKNGFLGQLNSEDMETCLKILINNGADVNASDKSLKTPLYYSITHTFPGCTKILIEHGAHLTQSSDLCGANYTLANQLAFAMPDVLLDIFDDSVTLENSGDEAKIRLDWRPILQFVEMHEDEKKDKIWYEPGENQSEISFMYSLLKGDHDTLKKLFKHPLLSAFLHLKYFRVRQLWPLSMPVVFFPLLYLTFVYHIYFNLCAYKKKENNSTENSFTNTSLNDENEEANKCEISWPISMWAYILAVIVCVWSGLKVYLCFRMGAIYFKSWRNWVVGPALICMGITLWPGLQFQTYYNITFEYPVAALGIFFGFVIFLLQIGSHPEVSVYLEVLVKILLSVLKIVLLFFPLFVGFYMGFRLMFDNRGSVFRFIIMTVDVGSAKYEDMIRDAKEDYFWFSAVGYAFCVSFIIIIVIVFMNFVLGTSISDIQKRKHEAKISNIAQKIQNAYIFDVLASHFSFLHRNVIKLEQLRNGEYFYEFSPNDSKCLIPKDIQTQLIKVINKRKYCVTKDQFEDGKDNESSKSDFSAPIMGYDFKQDLLLKKITNLEAKLYGLISEMD